jgi:hypothetical protein
MTTVRSRLVTCALCGHAEQRAMIGSTSSRGAPDLDTRPKWMAGVGWYVTQCPRCGYAATDLEATKGLDLAALRAEVASAAYQSLCKQADLPEHARRMRCHAELCAAQGDERGAGWANLWSAWCCDDARAPEGAASGRALALERFNALLASGEGVLREQCATLIIDTKGEPVEEEMPVTPAILAREQLLFADLHRRLGRFAEALHHCEEGLRLAPGAPVEALLVYERAMARRGDDRRYDEANALARMSPEAIAWSERLLGPGCLVQIILLSVGGGALFAHSWKLGAPLLLIAVASLVLWPGVVTALGNRLSRAFRAEMDRLGEGAPSRKEP